MSLRRGIEPIIATVILVAVALIIAVAVVGYLMGLFGGLTGGQPQISITSIRATKSNAANAATVKFELYINNAGAGSDKLLKVEVIGSGVSTAVSGKDACKLNNYNCGLTTADNALIVTGNHRGWVTLEVNIGASATLSAGDTVILKLYFERSGVQSVNVVIT